MINITSRSFAALLLLSVFSVNAETEKVSNDIKVNKETDKSVFARVGDKIISEQDFNNAFYQHLQSRFYHGKPPESQIEEVRRQVAKSMITRTLLLNEASRQKVACNQQVIQETIKEYDARYKSSKKWKQNRDSMITVLQERLCENDQLKQIETKIRKVSSPTQAQLRSYYQSNLDKFTEPGRQRISVILLGVAPSAPKSSWDAAFAEAKSIKVEIAQGAKFSEIASLRSSDPSAQSGGDMGYLHKGMLSPAAEETIDKLSIKELSEPVRLLEGVALFRVEERLPKRTRSYDEVQQRLQELWARDTSNKAWENYENTLWSKASVKVYDPKLSERINYN